MLGIRPWGIIVVYQSAPRASRWHESTPLDSPGDRQENDLPAKGQKGGPMNEQSLITRVNRLERENRRMKLAGVLVLLGITAVIVMGQSEPKHRIIEAEKFVVKDREGNVRVVLGGWNCNDTLWSHLNKPSELSASYGLYLYEPGGPDWRCDAFLGPNKFRLMDKNTPSSASLIIGSGYAMLSLDATDQPYESRRTLKTREGLAKLMRRLDGIDIAAFPRQSYLRIVENDKTRAALGHPGPAMIHNKGPVEMRSASSLVLFDKDGKVVWKAP